MGIARALAHRAHASSCVQSKLRALDRQGHALGSICFGRLQPARGWEFSGFVEPRAMDQGGMGNYQTPSAEGCNYHGNKKLKSETLVAAEGCVAVMTAEGCAAVVAAKTVLQRYGS